MTTETLQFAMYLTGHGEEDIRQMYRDWVGGELAEASQTDEEAAKAYADRQFIKPYEEMKDADQDAWIGFYEGYLAGLQQRQELHKEIKELKQWKAEALAVMPDMQAIGKAIGVPLGESIHDKILPAILQLSNNTTK